MLISLALDGLIDPAQGHLNFYYPDRKLRLERGWEVFLCFSNVCVFACTRACVKEIKDKWEEGMWGELNEAQRGGGERTTVKRG